MLNLATLPKFPEVDYELGFRKIIGIQEREAIIDELKKQTYHINPKIWLAVDMLCSYNKIHHLLFDFRGDVFILTDALFACAVVCNFRGQFRSLLRIIWVIAACQKSGVIFLSQYFFG